MNFFSPLFSFTLYMWKRKTNTLQAIEDAESDKQAFETINSCKQTFSFLLLSPVRSPARPTQTWKSEACAKERKREKGEGRENDSKTEADRPVLRGRDSETNRQMKQRNRERETKPKTGRDNDINEHRKVVMLTPPSYRHRETSIKRYRNTCSRRQT